jgi:hypothetical protein
MLVLILIAITLVFSAELDISGTKNVKFIFPLTDFSLRYELDINLRLTFLVDMFYLGIINALYLSSYDLIDVVSSNHEISIRLNLLGIFN